MDKDEQGIKPEEVASSEARDRLTELTNRARFAGERFVITRNGEAIAVIIGSQELELLPPVLHPAMTRFRTTSLSGSDMSPIIGSELRMTHQHNGSAVATARTHTEVSFAEAIQSVARRLYFSCPKADTSDRQFLQDVMRGECRYPMKGLERLARVAQQSTRPEHREALAEVIREFSTPLPGTVSLATAFDDETRAQGIADLEQRRFERERSRARQEAAIEALHAQEIATREAITAVRRTKVG